ncbi:hypothetical protein SH467x_003357 [Pirellulaceae bacterium SH467]
MCRYKRGQTIVVMHDGQPSLWNCEAAYQEGWDKVEILDLLHVLPRISASAKIICPEEGKRTLTPYPANTPRTVIALN